MATKGIRLIKAAKEFNVGMTTIVDFLSEKGHEVEAKPNTKLTGNIYDILLQEYQSDRELKRKSSEVTIGVKKKTEDSITEPEVAEPKAKKVEAAFEKEFSVKDNTSDTINEVIKVKIDKPKGLKVVGKIEEKKAVVKPEAKIEKEPEPIKKIEEKPKVEKQAVSKKEEPKQVEKTTPKKVIKVEPKEDAGPKVIGEINLKDLNQKTRPSKKSKKEIKQEKEQKKQAEKAILKKQQEEKAKEQEIKAEAKPVVEVKKVPEHIDTKIKKLAGPTVLGKIELPAKPEKKDKKKNEFKKKKKRKRVGKIDPNKPQNQHNKGKTPYNKDNDKKTVKKKNFKKGGRKRPFKEEVKEEDVQKQIKDTLARLQNKGKSKSVRHRRDKRSAGKEKTLIDAELAEIGKSTLKITEFVSVSEIASMMDVTASDIITTCMGLGLFVSINQRLDAETITLVADEYDHEVEFISVEVQESIEVEEDKEEDLVKRPPIVTVMGHVDHGKTKLLDYIRKENVIAGEAGGITQHIGAYSVKLKNGEVITFLDTPGHEAFTAMRARGTQVTDIAIIVIAADDGIKPQTKEAINHAQAAGVPIIFAINKIDKPSADTEKVKSELANLNLMVEDWGGKYQSQDVSAKSGLNIDELLEKVLLEAEMLELKANPNKKAVGSVVESSLDKGRGYLATIIVQSGTLKQSDVLIAGTNFGHIKAMYNERNERVTEAGPSMPVVVLGLNGAPQSGDNFNIMPNDADAREVANKREQLQREQNLRSQKHITLDEIGRRIAIGNFQELNVIIKGDVDGSIEALTDSLQKLSTDEIQVNVIHKGVGQISESDVLLAAASDAVIIGFQVRPSTMARRLAEKEEVEIRLYSIIYDAINELRDAMEGMLSPEIKETIISNLEVLEVFKITKVGTIAGCMVQDGKIKASSKVRIIREGIVKYAGELGALKRFKDDAKEVVAGLECGISIKNYNDIKVGDTIEAYVETEHKRTL